MAAPSTWTCRCGAKNSPDWHYCEGCGTEQASRRTAASPTRQAKITCDCGAKLYASGICEATGGYPGTSSCPHACPICRGPLGWDGGCERCHGCTTFPGDRYELDKAHWQRTDGPRKACTRKENTEGLRALLAVVAASRVARRNEGEPVPIREALAAFGRGKQT